MTRRSLVGLLLLVSCASPATKDLEPESPSKETRGAELPPEATDEPEEAAPPAAEPALFEWSFEPASADCNGWPVVGAEAIRATPARTGSYSCKLCADGSTPSIQLTKDLGAVPAGRYLLSAWVRSRAQNPAPGVARGRLDADGTDGKSSAATPSVTVRNDWSRLETTIDLAHGATELRLTVGTDAAEAGHCLFVDDVTLSRQP